ncbi:hypothetical protein V8G54_009125 [Vigna mungo]|uniref:TIR domain-containing protein n=1 Tax=Vigna mungo TaxID=3915 RepID=A0AAQ3S4J3_VIGMU
MSLSGSDDEMEMDFLRDRYHEKDGGNFEVFLSFRGEDTRASFTSHLYTALQNAGIFVFKDDESLPRGKQISPSLQLAIEESRISIVVFSKNYAESLWCMKELEKIMECHRTTGHVVLPVFYDVDPSEVRHQRGDFGKAFQRLLTKFLKEEDEKVLDWKKRWMKTLGEVGGFSTAMKRFLLPQIDINLPISHIFTEHCLKNNIFQIHNVYVGLKEYTNRRTIGKRHFLRLFRSQGF